VAGEENELEWRSDSGEDLHQQAAALRRELATEQGRGRRDRARAIEEQLRVLGEPPRLAVESTPRRTAVRRPAVRTGSPVPVLADPALPGAAPTPARSSTGLDLDAKKEG